MKGGQRRERGTKSRRGGEGRRNGEGGPEIFSLREEACTWIHTVQGSPSDNSYATADGAGLPTCI